MMKDEGVARKCENDKATYLKNLLKLFKVKTKKEKRRHSS